MSASASGQRRLHLRGCCTAISLIYLCARGVTTTFAWRRGRADRFMKRSDGGGSRTPPRGVRRVGKVMRIACVGLGHDRHFRMIGSFGGYRTFFSHPAAALHLLVASSVLFPQTSLLGRLARRRGCRERMFTDPRQDLAVPAHRRVAVVAQHRQRGVRFSSRLPYAWRADSIHAIWRAHSQGGCVGGVTKHFSYVSVPA